ncbi:SpoIID/LytB domain-containing protein [Spirulina sp. CS-785/01]|uniref:SpoIID/LytB domain-containing protein n=1 Tax=Spirulina sp. CS-785/01 TaxID=3021716 RepID=UPI00232AAB2E|nr:SpoIID/LytB domain-containing protein [Spirulina sp. CS-785/01]MDB9312622.1 SpoIID/LytB domain-containing protein [Spirulina sp. CS-785/01]
MLKKALLCLLLPTSLNLSCSLLFAPPAQAEVELDVGVVQRFGDETSDTLTLTPPSGQRLTVTFTGGDGEPETLTTSSLTLEINQKPHNEPLLQEWVVLSDHATFETAEDSAKRWEERGIETEVTQPGRWQVWAKRDVYATPTLRRKLVETLESEGETGVYLQSEVLESSPIVSFVIGNYRYNRTELEITSPNDRIYVTDGEDRLLFGGSLRIQPNAYGNYTLVNDVSLETYLRGVVPHEIGPNAPYNSVEAQTIIARTYALRNVRRFEADEYQLCATVHCQVYKGLTGTVENADRAIEATSGLVLTYENELVDALYSAHNGGVTAFFEDIWNGEPRPYLQAKVDGINPKWDIEENPLDDEANFRRFIELQEGFNGSDSVVFRWDRQSSVSELTEDLNRYLDRIQHPLHPVGELVNLAVTERSSSGRIRWFTVETDKGIIELEKTEARSAFGPPRSTLFYIDPVLDSAGEVTAYRFVGGGFGHGVGLSQYSSYTLAKQGWRYDRILEFYYPGATVEPLTEETIYYSEDN